MPSKNHYRLRGFRRSSQSDIELVNLMGFHPSIMKAKGYWKRGFDFEKEVDLKAADRAIFQTKARIERPNENVMYAVVDGLDKVVGWIWFYKDKTHRLPAAVAGNLGLSIYNSRIYQVSYEKLMSSEWPLELVAKAEHVTLKYLEKNRKGVIVEGLAKAILRLRRRMNLLYKRRHKLVVYAFTHPSNIASRKVLEKNKFERIRRKYSYDGVPHYLWVKVV